MQRETDSIRVQGRKFIRLELYKSLLADVGRFVYYTNKSWTISVRRGEVDDISETWTKRIAPFRADGKPDLSSRGVSPFIRGNSTIFHIKITRTFTVPGG